MWIHLNQEELIKLAARVHASKPRRFVTVADMLAVCQKEAGLVPIFSGQEPLYKQNLAAAGRITKLPEAQIIKACLIRTDELKGQISKFRCEPGYWDWAQKQAEFTKIDQFLLSCSFGMGQKMARWLVANTPKTGWIPLIERFKADPELQLLYVAGDLDQLMVAAGGLKPVAFTRYNEGARIDPKTKKAIIRVTEYGRIVQGYSTDWEKRL